MCHDIIHDSTPSSSSYFLSRSLYCGALVAALNGMGTDLSWQSSTGRGWLVRAAEMRLFSRENRLTVIALSLGEGARMGIKEKSVRSVDVDARVTIDRRGMKGGIAGACPDCDQGRATDPPCSRLARVSSPSRCPRLCVAGGKENDMRYRAHRFTTYRQRYFGELGCTYGSFWSTGLPDFQVNACSIALLKRYGLR